MFPVKSRASVSLNEIESSDCSARSMYKGFSIMSMAQLRLGGKKQNKEASFGACKGGVASSSSVRGQWKA